MDKVRSIVYGVLALAGLIGLGLVSRCDEPKVELRVKQTPITVQTKTPSYSVDHYRSFAPTPSGFGDDEEETYILPPEQMRTIELMGPAELMDTYFGCSPLDAEVEGENLIANKRVLQETISRAEYDDDFQLAQEELEALEDSVEQMDRQFHSIENEYWTQRIEAANRIDDLVHDSLQRSEARDAAITIFGKCPTPDTLGNILRVYGVNELYNIVESAIDGTYGKNSDVILHHLFEGMIDQDTISDEMIALVLDNEAKVGKMRVSQVLDIVAYNMDRISDDILFKRAFNFLLNVESGEKSRYTLFSDTATKILDRYR